MHTFAFARPATVGEACALLEREGPGARVLAGGTDLIIGLRDDSVQPSVVIDLKRIPELRPAIREEDGRVTISAGTTMTDLEADGGLARRFPALVEAAAAVGSIQIRNRATLVGNICNGSPAADTAPPLLVYDACVVLSGPGGTRCLPLDDFIVCAHQTALRRGELVTGIRLPLPLLPTGAAYLRATRRRGTDLPSVTLACSVDAAGRTRLAFGSVGPRPYLVIDDSGVLADRAAPVEAKAALLDEIFAVASPSPRSLRASPDYRTAMLRVLGARAVRLAIDRLAAG
ncbi:MAG: FAD binding domain-containing protein [Candidatus Limnocylindrales bacterium]